MSQTVYIVEASVNGKDFSPSSLATNFFTRVFAERRRDELQAKFPNMHYRVVPYVASEESQ